jgi:hypothetical protein
MIFTITNNLWSITIDADDRKWLMTIIMFEDYYVSFLQ